MTSNIDATVPATNAEILSAPIRQNFAIAKAEISALQASIGGVPGGSPGQVQFNNAGVFGGFTVSGDLTIDTSTGIAAIANGVVTNAKMAAGAALANLASGSVTNAKLANMADQTFKGNVSGGAAAPSDLTATQATAALNAMVGDSGAGVTKGLVPAATTGNASTAFLRKDGTWAIPAGSGSGTVDVVQDNSTTVSNPTNLKFTSGAVVSDLGGGVAGVAIAGIPAPTSAGSTLSVTSAMSGGDILLNAASGSVCTLPAATGSGARFRFIVTVVATSNTHIVKVHTHGEIFVGSIISEAPAGTANGCYTANGTDDTVSFNGTNNGHELGDWFEVSDIATGKWFVSGNSNAQTSASDPFSQTV